MIVFLSLKSHFVCANSADPDEMLCYMAFIWVFKVCQSNLLGDSGIQRAVIGLPFKVALFSTHNRST